MSVYENNAEKIPYCNQFDEKQRWPESEVCAYFFPVHSHCYGVRRILILRLIILFVFVILIVLD